MVVVEPLLTDVAAAVAEAAAVMVEETVQQQQRQRYHVIKDQAVDIKAKTIPPPWPIPTDTVFSWTRSCSYTAFESWATWYNWLEPKHNVQRLPNHGL